MAPIFYVKYVTLNEFSGIILFEFFKSFVWNVWAYFVFWSDVDFKGVMKRGCKMDVDGYRQASTVWDWKSAVWAMSTKKSAMARFQTVFVLTLQSGRSFRQFKIPYFAQHDR